VRPAGEIQKPGQHRDVEHHHQRDLALVHRPRDRPRSPAITEVVQLDREVGDQAHGDHGEQLGHRQRALEQELPTSTVPA